MKKVVFAGADLAVVLVAAVAATYALAGGDPVPTCSTNPQSSTGGATTASQAGCPVYRIDWSLGPAAPSVDASTRPVGFLQLEGISLSRGDIEILSFNWGEATTASTSGATGPGKATFQDISIVKSVDVTTPAIAEVCANHHRIPSARIAIVRPNQPSMVYRLSDVFCVLDKQGATGAPNGDLLEVVSLAYGRIEWRFTSAIHCWDLATDTERCP